MTPTLRLPLAFSIESRTASIAKDARMVNAYIDTVDDVPYVVKRPGTASLGFTPAIADATGYGMYPFNGKVFAGIGNHLYSVTSTGSTVDIGAIATGKLSFINTSQTPYLFLHNGTTGWTYNAATSTLAAVTDTNFPPAQTPALPLASGSAYLDDCVYVLTTNGRIYNSAIENPTSWGALDYISKTAEPDGGVSIAKHLNFVIAWGEWSAEFFYNAGNTTGSPLDRSSSYKMNIGCASGPSMVQFTQTVMWIGQSRETGRGVYMMDGISPIKVSTAAIDRYLNASTLVGVDAFANTIAGHTMYITSLPDLNVTLVYDMQEKRWYQWSTDSAGNDIVWQYGAFASLGGVSYLQNRTTGKIVTYSTSVYQDETANINYRLVSYIVDLKNNNNKFFYTLFLIGDTEAWTMQIRYSDDDYTTWCAYRTVDGSLLTPTLNQLGSAKRRAFEFLSTSNVAIRLQAAEFLIKQGTF